MLDRKRSFSPLLVLMVMFLMFLGTIRLFGQGAVTTGTIAGDMVDRSGAVVPGAKVTIRNTATAEVHTLTTDSAGHFVASQLPPGVYDVSAQLSGFKTSVIKNLILNVGDTNTVRMQLEVGQVMETVQVSSEVVAVDTVKSTVSNVIQEQQLSELPLNQRSFTALVTQQPGLVQITNLLPASPTQIKSISGSVISAGGLPGTRIAYLMDGIPMTTTAFSAPGTSAGGDMPGVEGIQEFEVLTHNFSAAYPNGASAVISFVTRGGTNQLHGNVYDFLRNDVLDARDFFDQQEKPPFRRNQFGASVSGPIKRDKIFFFANYEGLRQRLTTTQIAFVPSLCARNGGLGGTCNFPVIGPVLQPDGTYQRQPVAISPAVKSILDLYPLPNGPDFANGISELIFLNPQPLAQDYGVIKIDYNLTDKDKFSARYNITNADSSSAFNLPNFKFIFPSRLQNVVVSWNRPFGQFLVNTASFGYARSLIFGYNQPPPLQPSQYTGDPARQTIGNLTVSGRSDIGGALTNLGTDFSEPVHDVRNQFRLNDDVIYARGAHVLQFGGSITRYQWNLNRGQGYGGLYPFLSLNDFLAGNPVEVIIQPSGVSLNYGYRTTQLSWYVEDKWRLRKDFTVSLGLRHDFQVPILGEVHGNLGGLLYPTDSTLTLGQPPWQNYSFKQFQPRLGIAYSPFSKTAIRAGVGIFNGFLDIGEFEAWTIEYNAHQYALNTTFGEPIAPGFIPPIPFPQCPACVVPGSYVGLLTTMFNPMKSPTSYQWSFQVERELPGSIVLNATYSGMQAVHTIRVYEGNYPLPCSYVNGLPEFAGNCGTAMPQIAPIAFSVFAGRSDANAQYNAVSLSARRRFANGFAFQTSYTFGKGMSDFDEPYALFVGGANASLWGGDRHLDHSESMFSIRHRITVNGSYEFPFGKGKPFASKAHGALNSIIGGWRVNVIADFHSGIPFTILNGFSQSGADIISVPDRPDQLAPVAWTGDPNHAFDTRAFALQPPSYLGNAPRSPLRGPTFRKVDMSFGKRFQPTERVGIEFRGEMFNVFNHPNFGMPGNQLFVGGQPAFDHVPTQAELDALPCRLTAQQAQINSCNPRAGIITSTVARGRQVQFGLKVTF